MLLPNLIDLHLSANPKITHAFLYSIMFFQPTIRTLDITLPDPAQTSFVTNFLQEVTSRMPNIQDLTIRFHGSVRPFEAGLVKMLKQFAKLQQLTLPEYALTSNVMTAVSSLPSLHTISYMSKLAGCGLREDIQAWTLYLEQGAFPSLETATVSASFSDFSRFLDNGSSPQPIKSLVIRTTVIETPLSTRGLLTTVSSKCFNLTTICLDLCMESASALKTDLRSSNFLLFADIKPLLAVPSITTFRLSHHHRVVLTDDNILELIRAWPNIENLWLNPEPIVEPPPSFPGLSASCLVHFMNCPKLEFLGLHIDFSRPIPEFQFEDDVGQVALNSLMVNFGTSPIDNNRASDVAVFLSVFKSFFEALYMEDFESWSEAIFTIVKDEARTGNLSLKRHRDEWETVWDMLEDIERARM